MKKSLVYVFLTCLITGFAWGQDTRPTIAILDFEGQGISVQEVQTLTERMRSEIGSTNAVRLIERKAIESIMAEQGLANPVVYLMNVLLKLVSFWVSSS